MGINLELIKKVNQNQIKTDVEEFRTGDTVKVHIKIKEGKKERIQIFEGFVLKRQSKELNATFTVRKESFGVGVEKTFFLNSPSISKIEVVKLGKVRQSKIFYMRDRKGKSARIPLRIKGASETAPKPVKNVEEPVVIKEVISTKEVIVTKEVKKPVAKEILKTEEKEIEDLNKKSADTMKEISKNISKLKKTSKNNKKSLDVKKIKGVGVKTKEYLLSQKIETIEEFVLFYNENNEGFPDNEDNKLIKLILGFPGVRGEKLKTKIKKLNNFIEQSNNFLKEFNEKK